MIHSDSTDNDWKLVDGQQRLVSLTIIASAIRDILIENGHYKMAYDLHWKIIAESDSKKNYLKPRCTEKFNSPRKQLEVVQAPTDYNGSIKFNFEKKQVKKKTEEDIKLKQEIEISFPISQGQVFDICPGVKFESGRAYEPGKKTTKLYGKLEMDPKDEIEPKRTLILKQTPRKDVRDKLDKKLGSHLIWRHYLNCKKTIKEGLPKKKKKQRKALRRWSDITAYMVFTTTTFDNEEDAIFYFGKLNDADNSMQLNVGDLMRQRVHWIVKQEPIDSSEDNKIKNMWDDIENVLKNETKSKNDRIPKFLEHWMISKGEVVSERKVFGLLKQEMDDEFREGSNWKKDGFLSWLTSLKQNAEKYAQIVEPNLNDDYCILMKGIEGVSKQHRPLFLSGLMSLEKEQMKRLIKIYEYLLVKGVLLPTLLGFDGVPSNTVYGWARSWSNDLYVESNKFEDTISNNAADGLLDDYSKKVENSCKSIWDSAESNDKIKWDSDSMKDLQVTNSEARLLLTRIEFTRAYDDKKWTLETEVEHILPSTWHEDWGDKKKGGHFEESTYKKWRNYLGNRTLLSPNSNKYLRNKGFHEKQTVKKHGYDNQQNRWAITGDITSDKQKLWSPETIKVRTESLAGELVKIYTDDFLKKE